MRRLLIPLLACAGLLASPVFAQHAGHQSGMEGHHHAGGHLGAEVMPFDLARSRHVFTPQPDGGTQDVLSRDGDASQISLIREHLRKEAAAFARGDFGDPSSIHGEAMPGLKELRAGAAHLNVRYEDLPKGARIRFTTSDPALVKAVHRWFEAQVRDHGADAEMRRP